MDIGSGIAIGSFCVGVFGTATTAIVKFTRKNGFVRKDVCDERTKRIEQKIDTVTEGVSEIKSMIKNGK